MEQQRDGTGNLVFALGLLGAWGLGVFLLAKDKGMLDGLGEDAPPSSPPLAKRVSARRLPPTPIAAPTPEPEVSNRRFLARKFYGTFVLAQQGAQAMDRAQKKSGGKFQQESASVQQSLRDTARRSIAAARSLDPSYIDKLCSRPNAPSCGV